jgi:hypothetical protein
MRRDEEDLREVRTALREPRTRREVGPFTLERSSAETLAGGRNILIEDCYADERYTQLPFARASPASGWDPTRKIRRGLWYMSSGVNTLPRVATVGK